MAWMEEGGKGTAGRRPRAIERWAALGAVLTALCGMVWPAGPGEAAGQITNEELRERRALWQSMGLSGGGAMVTPVISPHDPDLMLVGCDMGGAYRTTDGGRHWEMIHHDQLRWSWRHGPALFDASEANTIYAASGWERKPVVSSDRGESWRPFGGDRPRDVRVLAALWLGQLVPRAEVLRLVLAGCEEGAYYSCYRMIERRGGFGFPVFHWGWSPWEQLPGIGGKVVGFHVRQAGYPLFREWYAATEEGGIYRVRVSRSADITCEQVETQGLPAGRAILAFTGGSNQSECVLYCSVAAEILGDGTYEGGVYRSTDGGVTWEQVMENGIYAGEAYDWMTGTMRAAQYDFVLTTDGEPATVYAVRAMPLDAPGAGVSQVYRSDDKGESWSGRYFVDPIAGNVNVEANYITAAEPGMGEAISGGGIDPNDPDRVILTHWTYCQLTEDGGGGWRNLHTRRAPNQPGEEPGPEERWGNTGLTVTGIWHYYVDPFKSDRHYYGSDDGGATWCWPRESGSWGDPVLRNTTYELAFDPEEPGLVWGAFSNMHDIPNGNIIRGQHYWDWTLHGGVAVSTDHGENWAQIGAGLPDKPVTSIVLDPRSPKGSRVLYASCFEDGVYKSEDGGLSWVRKSSGLGAPGNMRCCRLILHGDGTLFCLVTALMQNGDFGPEGPGLYRSLDGGESWGCVTVSQPLLWPKDFDVDPLDSDVIYLGAADAWTADDYREEGGLYRTSDGGETWLRVAREGWQTFGASVHPRRPGWVYMTLCEGAPGPGLWLSKDGGETWKPFWGIPFSVIQRVEFDPYDDSIIYVCTFGGGVWKGPAEEPGV
jgi:photosystem II stability/assembly factor-like uncharacterized protein